MAQSASRRIRTIEIDPQCLVIGTLPTRIVLPVSAQSERNTIEIISVHALYTDLTAGQKAYVDVGSGGEQSRVYALPSDVPNGEARYNSHRVMSAEVAMLERSTLVLQAGSNSALTHGDTVVVRLMVHAV